MTNEKPYIVMGACLDRWRTGSRKTKQRDVEDHVLLSFAMEVNETQLAQERHFLYEHLQSAPTKRTLRTKARLAHEGHTGLRCAAQTPTRNLRSVLELLGVLDSAEAPTSPACVSRDTLRGAWQHNVTEKEFRCVNNCSEVKTMAAPCLRWTHPKWKCCRESIERSTSTRVNSTNAKTDGFFSPTPPLEELRLLLSHAASSWSSSTGDRKIPVADAWKVHLHAFAERNLHVAPPPEARVLGMCARLRPRLYGSRDALERWEASLAKQLDDIGFMRGAACPCCIQHSGKDLRCVGHGDAFVFGLDKDLE